MIKREIKHTLNIKAGDQKAMRNSRLGLNNDEVVSFAAVRAAGREAFLMSKSVSKTLSAMVSDLPSDAVDAWMRESLKASRAR